MGGVLLVAREQVARGSRAGAVPPWASSLPTIFSAQALGIPDAGAPPVGLLLRTQQGMGDDQAVTGEGTLGHTKRK